jgi:hypothetical protein
VNLDELGGWLAEAENDGAIDLPYKGRTFRVPPPSTPRAVRVAAYVDAVSTKVPEDPEEREARKARILDALGGQSLELLALGQDVSALLRAADVPAPVVWRMAMYAALVWAWGVERADRAAVSLWGGSDPKAPRTSPPTAPRSRKKSGTATASASKTQTRASGPAGIGSQPT